MSNEALITFRKRVEDHLGLLASTEAQNEYQKNVPFVNVPDELLCQWFDDLDMPKSLERERERVDFSSGQIKLLKQFNNFFDSIGFLIRHPNSISLTELHKTQEWKRLVTLAKQTLISPQARLKTNRTKTSIAKSQKRRPLLMLAMPSPAVKSTVNAEQVG